MPKYQAGAIDETAFLEFVDAPPSQLLAEFIKALASDKQANSFFKIEPPVWADDPASWVKGHLRKQDWYRELSEPEAVAWDSAIDQIRTRFKSAKRIKAPEHGEIHFHIFELAEEMFLVTRATIRCYA